MLSLSPAEKTFQAIAKFFGQQHRRRRRQRVVVEDRSVTPV